MSDEDIFQNKQDCKYIHCRSEFLEVSAYEIDENIGNHSDEETV